MTCSHKGYHYYIKCRVTGIAIPLFLLATASVVIVETVNRKKFIFTLAILQVVYRFILDSLFYGGYAFSLDMGVLGVAWADAAANLALFISATILLRTVILEKARGWASFFTFRDWKTYLRVGGWSGLDSLVRNVAYFFMIVRLLNLLGENSIGGYYLAMHIFWSFMLVPILALAETAKVLIANHSGDIQAVRRLWYSALAIGGVIVVVWMVLLPLWDTFAALLNSNGEVVRYSSKAMSLLIIPYVLLALNLVADAIFYGTGRTRYMAYQAIITNGTVYIVAFILYLTDVWTPTFTSIMILFGIGILVDSILTIYYAFRVLSPSRKF